jgi:hypothetical protein
LLYALYARLDNLKKIHTMRTIGKIQSPRAFEILLKLLDSEKDPGLMAEIFSAMKQFKDESYARRTRAVLLARANDPASVPQRVQTMRFLAEVSPEDAVTMASQGLAADLDNDLAITSLDILKKYGDQSAARVVALFRTQTASLDLVARSDDALKAIEDRVKISRGGQ